MNTPEKSDLPQSAEREAVKPGNVFEGVVVYVVQGHTSDLVTLLVAPGIELTVTLALPPFVGEVGRAPRPIRGDRITIGLPPPPAIPLAFGPAGRY